MKQKQKFWVSVNVRHFYDLPVKAESFDKAVAKVEQMTPEEIADAADPEWISKEVTAVYKE